MFQVISTGLSLPTSFPVDPSAEFLPGQIAQLGIYGNNVVCGVSDGTAPLGIIDDVKTNAFSSVSVDEVVISGIIPSVIGPYGRPVSSVNIKVELANASIIPDSFISDPVDVGLIARNGVIEFLAGTELNFDLDGDGTPDSIRTVVSYSYYIPNVPGEDSTIASKMVTVWYQPFIGATDQFETSQRYPVNAPLFVSEGGKLTVRKPSPDHPVVAIVLGPPTSITGSLQFMWR